MTDISVLANRLKKNQKRLAGIFDFQHTDCYRLYDRDIPDCPIIIDRYHNYFIVYFRTNPKKDSPEKVNLIKQSLSHVLTELAVSDSPEVVFKEKIRAKGGEKYAPQTKRNITTTTKEHGLIFKINPYDYHDVGLFLDHRPLRQMVKKDKKAKSALNLFCYTGAISVALAAGGKQVTSVDLSQNYLDWAQDNFKLNGLPLNTHKFEQSDVIEFLKNDKNQYDLIVCDPPTFSNSKKRQLEFEVQRDQCRLIEFCMARLNPEGTLYFSCNKRDFKLDASLFSTFHVKDISLPTIPSDFNDKKIHQCYEIKQ